MGRRVVEVIDAAFAEDPWLAWTIPDRGAARSLMSLFLRSVALPHGQVLLAGREGDEVVGAAILLPPGGPGAVSQDVGAMVMALHGRRIGQALDADAVIDVHRPSPAGWVLHTLAVHPGAQGVGVGTALLNASLAVAARDPTPLTLETANPKALPWYRRRGFVVDHEVVLGRGHGFPPEAPTVWLLSHGGH